MGFNNPSSVLPKKLLAQMKWGGGLPSWPLSLIPPVIEAYRVKGLINRGGDLQIIELSGVWESPNIGVWVFDNELDGTDPQQRVYEAARIALAKFASLDAEELREEAVAGCPFLQGDATQYDPATLRFSWSAEPTSC